MTAEEALEQGLRALALDLGPEARDKLLAYIALLAKWNATYNLTAIRAPEAMVRQHLLDSLAVLPHLPLPAGAGLADVGSGGGLPGIPLAIARQDCRVALNDSSEKKAAFLRQAAMELRLANVDVHHVRAEQWRPAERFAVVISRAFAALADFLARCGHLVAADGVLAAMKGADPSDEMRRLPEGCRCGRALRIQVPLLDAERHLVLCRMER